MQNIINFTQARTAAAALKAFPLDASISDTETQSLSAIQVLSLAGMRRERIFAAARRLIDKTSLRSLTLEAIAEDARIPIASVIIEYPSKEILVAALIENAGSGPK